MKKFAGVGIVLGVIIAIIAVFGMMFAGNYNSLVNAEENVNLAKTNVETMMQRRLELIPDLVETVKAYTKHEEKVLSDIASARATLSSTLGNENASTEDISKANSELTSSIGALVKVVNENYPQLASSQQYTALMDQLEGSVNRISIAREEYNEKVNTYNKKIRKFPTNIFAGMFGFEKHEEFKADEAANKTNMVDFGD